jgi:PAS domain S-box-containing protein
MDPHAEYHAFDRLLEGCQVIGFDYRYLYVNEAVIEHGRIAMEELLGHTMVEAYPGIDSTPMFSVLERCMDSREPAELENEFTYPDGSTAWFMLKMEPVPEGVFILSFDITSRKRAEQELAAQLKRVQALREIDLAILATTDLPFTLHTVLEKTTDLLAADAADILLVDPETEDLEFAAGLGFRSSGIEQSRLRIGQGHAGRAAAERAPVIIEDLRQSGNIFLRRNLIKDEGFVSAVFVPLVAKGQPVGVLEVFHRSRLSADRAWLEYLETLAGQAAIAIESGRMFHGLLRSNVDLGMAYDTTIEGWSRALDLRDKETEGHTLRVTQMTVALAQMAAIPASEIVHVRRGALLHDIGKMGVPDHILLKPDKLTDAEWEIMRKHPVFAYELLAPIEYLQPALDIPHYHHEKWDGTGYPEGLAGEDIPLPARLFAVADVWDAITNDRPYRSAWSREDAIEHIRQQDGSQFDPLAVDLFLQYLGLEHGASA